MNETQLHYLTQQQIKNQWLKWINFSIWGLATHNVNYAFLSLFKYLYSIDVKHILIDIHNITVLLHFD